MGRTKMRECEEAGYGCRPAGSIAAFDVQMEKLSYCSGFARGELKL